MLIFQRECVSIHIGQAGVQMGQTCWELYLLEHGFSKDGRLINKGDSNNNDTFDTFFDENEGGTKYVPRAIMVDLEPAVVGM